MTDKVLSFRDAPRRKKHPDIASEDRVRSALSVALLQTSSKELFEELRAAKRKVRENPDDKNCVFAMVMAFEKWARRARQGGVDTDIIDYIFEEMRDAILGFADDESDPMSLAHFAVLLDHARYINQKVERGDIAVLSETARRDAVAISTSAEAAVEGILFATQTGFDAVTEELPRDFQGKGEK